MLTLTCAGAVLVVLGWMAFNRRAAILAAAFLLFSLVTRTLSLIYVDLADPIYSEQLDLMVGGGSSMPLFACSVLIPVLLLSYVFRPAGIGYIAAIKPRPGVGRDRAAAFVLVFLGLFISALYGDLITRGPIPLFADIDRLEYNAQMAGPLHSLVFDFGFLLAGLLGIMFVRPRVAGRDFDFAFLGLYLAMLAYFALTGNRFSAFYSFTSFFVLPLAAVPALSSCGRLPPPPGRSAWKRLLCSRLVVWSTLVVALVGIAGLLLNSVIYVRAYDDPLAFFAERILVQPVELWWATWHDLAVDARPDSTMIWEALFGNPIDPTRNTSIQMLMVKYLGWERATQLLEMGQQYAGGYPEVLFDLFGPWLALPVALLFSIPTALLLRLIVISTCEGRILTAVMALYVYFGFSLLYVGGMLNFLAVWTFWVKVCLLALVYWLERLKRIVF